jgi:hypothetical protein
VKHLQMGWHLLHTNAGGGALRRELTRSEPQHGAGDGPGHSRDGVDLGEDDLSELVHVSGLAQAMTS